MLKNLNVPLIKNYEDFKELNDRIKSSGRADLFRIQIIGVSYVYEEIKIVVDGDEGGNAQNAKNPKMPKMPKKS